MIFSLKKYDITLTSYGIVRSDLDKFKKAKWFAVVVDEAQNIKNTVTAQTKAVKSLKAKTFIAMSGTPVENRLSEILEHYGFRQSRLSRLAQKIS